MLKEEFSEKMKSYAKEIEIVLKEEQIDQFFCYMEQLLKWN